MKRRRCHWMIGTGLATALIFGTAGCENFDLGWFGNDDDNAAAQDTAPAADGDDVMEAWMAFGRPGPQHDWLRKFEGTWTVSGSWVVAPDAEPTPISGTSTFTMILDGHFLKEYNVSDDADMPFEGLGYLGFDKATNQYTAIWMDSMSTSIMQASGSFDETAGKLVTTGTYYDPMTGSNKSMRSETWFIDDDTIQADMFTTGANGKMFRSMTMQYHR